MVQIEDKNYKERYQRINNSDKSTYENIPSNCTSITEEEAKNVEICNSYFDFVDAYDNVDVRKLSDKNLQRFRDLCENGVLEADRELRRRGL